MGSISSPDSDPSPRHSAAGTQAQSSESIEKSPVQGANLQSSINQGESPGVEAGSAASRAESAAELESVGGRGPDEGGCLKVELDLPADVLGALDDAAAAALVGHLRKLGYKVDPPNPKDAPKKENAKPTDPTPPQKTTTTESAGKPYDYGTATISNEVLFDISTEASSLSSCLMMLDPMQGMIDTAEAMAYPKDANGRCGLDCIGIWMQKLFGVNLEHKLKEGDCRTADSIYHESMLVPELIRDAVRHRLERLSLLVSALQDHEAK